MVYFKTTASIRIFVLKHCYTYVCTKHEQKFMERGQSYNFVLHFKFDLS